VLKASGRLPILNIDDLLRGGDRKRRTKCARDRPPLARLSSAQKRGRTNLKKLRVLIVDDSSVMRKIVERSLRQAGLELAEVLEASNGVEGLAAAQKGGLDLILSDINMPSMDGIEFVRNLAGVEAAKGVPVIMITTEGSEARVVEALSVGAKGYIRKPFTPEQVKERVSALIGGN
jgi:two-component system, chemotaxis family, chemotaxis protein CheY